MSVPKLRGTLIGLELFTAVGAIAGAIYVVPGLPREWLAGGLFTDYTIPALALGILCGGGSLTAAALVVWRPALGGIVSVSAVLGAYVSREADASELWLSPNLPRRGAI